MFNYQIIIEYLGTDYIGWQIQKNGLSIQQIVQDALSKVLNSKIKINGSGRTDAGVHAKGQSANFIFNREIKDRYKFLNSINFFLKKKSISITKINKKKINFHARHSAKRKIYKYIILNRSIRSPMYDKRAWLVKNKLNVEEMRKGIKFYLGKLNFTSMRATSCVAKSPIRTITKAQINRRGDKIEITFESKSFLQKQVRSMVGCLKYVGENKWKPEKIKSLIKQKKRELCAPPAPPEGLYLEKVFY
jgi:tRNA pseudouridine38-40 synthase